MNLIEAVRRNPIIWAGAALVVVALVLSSVVIVPETRQALVLRFGQPGQGRENRRACAASDRSEPT